MNLTQKPGKNICNSIRAIDAAVRAAFDDDCILPNSDATTCVDIPGYVERRKLFFSYVRTTIRTGDLVKQNIQAWRQAVCSRSINYDEGVEHNFRDAIGDLISLTDFLIAKSYPSKAGFAFHMMDHRLLNACNKWAKSQRETWTVPCPNVPIVHEGVELSPEGETIWHEIMDPNTATGKPIGYKPRGIAIGK